jgi:hypothetical protein
MFVPYASGGADTRSAGQHVVAGTDIFFKPFGALLLGEETTMAAGL